MRSDRFGFRLTRWFAMVLLVLSAMACGGPGGEGGRGGRHRLEAPAIQASVAQFVGADGQTLSLRLELQAYNPNRFDLLAHQINGSLAIAGQQIATARVEFERVLPAMRPLPVVANITVPRAAFAGLAASPMFAQAAAAAPAQIPFTISGQMIIDSERRRRRDMEMSVPFTVQAVVAREMLVGLLGGGAVMPPGAMQPPPSSGGAMQGGPADRY
jgi:hypothetical protein